MPDVTILLEAYETAFTVTVEPWAAPRFEIRPGERCAVTIHHPHLLPTVTCAVAAGEMVVTAHESGSTFSFARGSITEFSIPDTFAIPKLSGL